jgi:hypothetical protein
MAGRRAWWAEPRLALRMTALPFCLGVWLSSAPAAAQTPGDPPPAAATPDAGPNVLAFLAGAGVGLVVHEGGHFVFDEIFDARPRVIPVHFGPVPFFAVSPQGPLSPRQLFTVTSAGFWTQSLTSEWLLTRQRDLRHARAPLATGLFAFNVLTSIGYAAVAFAGRGPVERDTKGMAQGLGVSERTVGLLMLSPAALDAYRYFRPDSAWARWASRVAKAASVVLVVKAPAR